MTVTERKGYVETKTKEREKIQEHINLLNTERTKFVAEKSKQLSATNTLDSVVLSTVREQASKRNYTFK
jgi:hypothetical protein